ncbi:MAG TPA: plasmid pRiA4b ORF-3 family protein [Solirubrobacteraceae bacterium]|nr:plasmid pRiA4b ORF-3 family protein [Solirubrobacteraceae bacterium]
MSQHTPAHNVIVQIKIKLLGVTKPPVWRRVRLRADTRLDQLHEILQAALGWENYHLHAFSFDEQEFGPRDPELALDFSDERRVTLGQLTDIGTRFRYTYDFGDNWEHEIVVEDLLDPDPDTHYPILVAAKGACPPEDCGGPWGYTDLKAILADPNDEQHQEMLEWLSLENGIEFDPNAVPNDDITYELALTGASR